MAVGAFLAVVARHALAAATVPAPSGATTDAEGRWLVGDVLLSDRASLCASLKTALADDDRLVLAAMARHGVRATERLHGEYAFVAWDAPRRTLMAARDGLGLRLLYVAVSADEISASDDPTRLLARDGVDGSLDAGALVGFLAGTIDEDLSRTVYRGVHAVPAGHTLVWTADGTTTDSCRHWEFPAPPVMGRREARDLPAQFTAVLDAAVSDRLRGPSASILLSGGIDSASIAASVRRTRPDVALRAFTATYEPLLPDLELPWTQRVASQLDLPVEIVRCAEQPPLTRECTGRLPQPLDEPTWPEWRRLTHAAARWSQTTLYGQDGDALLLPSSLREMIREESWPSVAVEVIRFVGQRRRLPYLGTGLRRLSGAPLLEGPPPLPPWLRASRDLLATPPSFFPVRAFATTHREWPRRRLTTGAWQSLVRAFSPAWTGAPSAFRLPLLDDRLLALAMSAPSVPWMQGKELIRQAAVQSGALPAAVAWRPKAPVRGHHEALVAQWRATWNGRVTLAPALREWVDVPILERVLRRGTHSEVSDAWRALELSDWIEARHERQESA